MLETKVLQFLSHNIVLISIHVKVKLFKVTPKAYPLLKETTKNVIFLDSVTNETFLPNLNLISIQEENIRI
mgnify:CR=1 FL=1